VNRSLTLILGGARSGKSAYAERLAARAGGRILYVATAEAGDDEMAERIAAHRAGRPAGWTTLEAPRGAGAAILATGMEYDVVLLDCLTLLANNVIVPLPEPISAPEAEAALRREVDSLLAVYAASSAKWLVISNEVGLGLVPPYPLGRVYRDALGRANQQLAGAADHVYFMVAGLPLVVKGELPPP
jgi:adenosylcobinamide kinase/adenosylcobinamide-phosphate guanylyltransferase